MDLNLLRRPWLRTALIAGAAAFGLGILTSAWTQSGPADTAHFDVYAEGDTIHLLTGHGKKGGPSILLFHRVSKDGGASWSKPVRVNAGTERLSAHHPGENPSIAGSGNRLVVAWTAPRPAVNNAARRGGLIQTAVSDDGGATWKTGPSPYADAAGSQTFMRMTAASGAGAGGGAGSGIAASAASGNAESRAMHMVWLDSREGRQGLRYARSNDLGTTWGKDVALAPRTCDCCWNSIATRPGASGEGEVSVLYRGGEPRDMMHMASTGGAKWNTPASIGGFDWRIQGCPHVGGALAVQGKVLHALVWTGKDGALGLYHSSLAAEAGAVGAAGAAGAASAVWSKPAKLGTDDAKNADLTIGSDGTLIAVWDEAGGSSSPLRLAKSADGSAWSTPVTIAASKEATHPRVVAAGGTLVAKPPAPTVLWLEGSPWNGARLFANGREVPSPVQ